MPFPREHDPWELVREGDGDVRERLVVPQPNVEGRPVALDQVLLEKQGLRLVAGDDDLDVCDSALELGDCHTAVAALEVAAHARPERLRLAHVERFALLVAKDVDARLAREPGKRSFKVFTHSLASVAPCVEPS